MNANAENPVVTSDACLSMDCTFARCYLVAMRAAQGLELALGTLVVLGRLTTHRGLWLRASDSPSSLHRRLTKMLVERPKHPLVKATGTELRQILKAEGIVLPPDLEAQVGRAINARNHLAHRFLREHATSRPGFDPRTATREAMEHQTLLTSTMVAVFEFGQKLDAYPPRTPGDGELQLPLPDQIHPLIAEAADAMVHGVQPTIDERLRRYAEQAIAERDRRSGAQPAEGDQSPI